MGVGQVIESHRQLNLYYYVYTAVAVKIVQENDTDIYFAVMQGNEIPENMVNKVGMRVLDSHTWIAVSRINADILGNHL